MKHYEIGHKLFWFRDIVDPRGLEVAHKYLLETLQYERNVYAWLFLKRCANAKNIETFKARYHYATEP